MRPLLLSFLALAAGAAAAQGPVGARDTDPSPHSEARLVADASRIAPGDRVEVALEITVEDGWHIYWINPGDSGQPVAVEWSLGGATAGPLRFPPPGRYVDAGLVTYAHSGVPSFVTEITVPPDAAGEVEIEAAATWLICADVCLPASADLSLTLPVGATVRTGALDAALAALPTRGTDWTASAAWVDGGYALSVDPPGDVSLDGATFFVDQQGVLDHGAEQSFGAEGSAWAVRLPSSPYAQAPTDELSGVLVAGDTAVALTVPVSGATVAAEAPTGAPTLSVWAALGFAFLGGVILNLMPCVFPILSIKILGFVRGRDQSPAALRAHGLAFGAGVVLSFMALAGALLALKATTDGVGWGFQLTYPPVVAGLAVLMTALALNLLGVFEIGQRLASVGGTLDRKEGLGGAFGSGVLAVVVASPCSAPFMGGALGYALVQPAAVALAVFGALGVGMALPYVLLSFKPAWLERLPKPGAWMETLKHALAFPLLATAVWLVWVFGGLLDLDAAALLLLALVAVALAGWAWGRSTRYGVGGRARWLGRAVGLGAVAGAVALVTTAMAPPQEAWQPYDAATVDALVADGQPVFVDVTATWCLSCQVNKQTTLSTDTVRDAFAAAGVTMVLADWTTQDPAITAFLGRFGRSGVPLYVLYPGGEAEPVVLPEVLTPGIVLDALGTAGENRAERRP